MQRVDAGLESKVKQLCVTHTDVTSCSDAERWFERCEPDREEDLNLTSTIFLHCFPAVSELEKCIKIGCVCL